MLKKFLALCVISGLACAPGFANSWILRPLDRAPDLNMCLDSAEEAFNAYSGVWENMNVYRRREAVYAFTVGMADINADIDLVILCQLDSDGQVRATLMSHSDGTTDDRHEGVVRVVEHRYARWLRTFRSRHR